MHSESVATPKNVKQIREICAELGVDEEMTALILLSHRNDGTLATSPLDDDDNLHDYVRSKLAIWVNIFEGPIR